jgi:hypothetical protein
MVGHPFQSTYGISLVYRIVVIWYLVAKHQRHRRRSSGWIGQFLASTTIGTTVADWTPADGPDGRF